MPKLSISSQGSHQQLHSLLPRGMPASHISAASSTFLSENQDTSAASSVFLGENRVGLSGKIPVLHNKRRYSTRAQARERTSGGLSYPKQNEKPAWWWRTLACLPYLISLQISEAGFLVQPFLEHHEFFEDLIFYIPGVAKRWPSWFIMVYVFLLYMGVVQNDSWPHFFRYHLMTAMLLETALQVLMVSSNFLPLIHYKGTFGMYYWLAVGFVYICILLEGIRCALAGKNVKIPFISEAALIHTRLRVGGFHRPF
ncbi:Chloroplast protein import component [Trema orientale]|uniref:Protein TIC 20 n=1 Tax=Trema orientale TaxID=63057 RepID=A0A2P5E8R5_TREOI|nr:Chloroplast protein import component [Trema orientale]